MPLHKSVKMKNDIKKESEEKPSQTENGLNGYDFKQHQRINETLDKHPNSLPLVVIASTEDIYDKISSEKDEEKEIEQGVYEIAKFPPPSKLKLEMIHNAEITKNLQGIDKYDRQPMLEKTTTKTNSQNFNIKLSHHINEKTSKVSQAQLNDTSLKM